MIKSLRLQNFKAFQDTGTLSLKPLTVLAGPNSGGKSSILQSLLLLKQTLEGPPDIHLNLDGGHLQFSAFNELTFGKPPLSRCHVSYQFEIETPIPRDIAPRYFAYKPLPDDPENLSLLSKLKLLFRFRGPANKKSILVDRFEVSSLLSAMEGPYLRGTYKDDGYRTVMRGKGVRFPDTFRDRRIKTLDFTNFLPYFLIFEGDEESHHAPHRLLNPIFLNPFQELRDEFEDNVKYLGPLRERPRRAYLHSGSPLTEIGDSGQYAAQLLWLEKDRKVTYLPAMGEEPKEVSLMEAVNDAFLRLGMLQPIDVRSEKSVIYQILFPLKDLKPKEAVTIADVGFGVSQLLPILVLGLRAQMSSILLLEQPEIHLHPKLQANLADFLLTLAIQGVRVIVETHSDHFINRLRRRIAEEPTDELRNKVNILFVHPPQEEEGATIDPLQIDRFGVIENWPPDFLPEATDEAQAILLAGLQKRGEG